MKIWTWQGWTQAEYRSRGWSQAETLKDLLGPKKEQDFFGAKRTLIIVANADLTVRVQTTRIYPGLTQRQPQLKFIKGLKPASTFFTQVIRALNNYSCYCLVGRFNNR